MEGLKGLGAYVAAGTAFIATAANLSKAVMDLDSSFMTTREKALGFAAAIPVVGDSIARFMGTLMDARDRMLNESQYKNVQRMREENPVLMAQASARHDYQQRKDGLMGEIQGAGFNAQAIGEFPTITSGEAALKSSVGGMAGAFLDVGLGSMDPRLKEGLQGVQSARRAQRVAELNAGSSQSDVDKSQARSNQAQARWRAAKAAAEGSFNEARGASSFGGNVAHETGLAYEKRFGKGAVGTNFMMGLSNIAPSIFGVGATVAGGDKGTNLSMQEAELKLAPLEHAAKLALAELEKKITDNKQNQLALDRSRYEVAKADTALMKGKLSILEEQYAKAKAGQQQFGGMDATDQFSLLQSARRFKEGGRENVTAGEFAQLQGNALTREFVGKRAEEDAANNPMLKALQELTGMRNAEDLKQERDKLTADIDMKVQFDEEKFAEVMKKSLEKLNPQLIGLIERVLELKLADPEGGVRRAHAGGGL